MIRPLEVRFWEKVARWGAGPDECWEWDAARQSSGYGKIGIAGHTGGWEEAHRVSWVLTHGPIPSGQQVLHRCDNPPCVNPAHLWLGTQRENLMDMQAKGRSNYPKVVQCKWGHPFDEENTYVYPNGERGCRACARRHGRQRRERLALEKVNT